MDDVIPASRDGKGVRGGALRRHNLAAVLAHLHASGAESRAQLAVLTGLNRSTVAGLVAELGKLGLAEEDGLAFTPGPGRPSPIVRAIPGGAVTLAVELTIDSLAVAVFGLGGGVLAERRIVRTREPLQPADAVAQIVELAAPMLRDPYPARLAGIGVAVAGITNRERGEISLGPNLGWSRVPLTRLLTAALADLDLPLTIPIRLANEANLGALAEHRRGAGRNVDDLLYVSGEVGIGVGVIANGTPMLGTAGYAGEAGHMLVDPRGTICGCGARGCWETAAGERALLGRAGVAPSTLGHLAVDEVVRRADLGDAAATKALWETGWWLGVGFGDLVNLFNPQLVVLGGLYHRLFPHVRDAVHEGFTSRVLHASGHGVQLVASQFGEGAPLRGAAELAFTPLLSDPASLQASGIPT